ncbi:MAG: Copper homeostasis protein CutC [Phycisphaerae bacterium]|nr:Copper homeostasis protein CutC [Phycisphaerae bacterium]
MSVRAGGGVSQPVDGRRPPVVEIAVDSLAGAVAAARGGADRIELAAALELDGLTPTVGLLRQVRRCAALPVMAMVRPRGGDFVYSRAEFEAMCDDAELLLANGAAGVVFGILTADGRVDVERCGELVDLVGRRGPCVFHRAFDVVRDAAASLERLIELRFSRVLTTGCSFSADRGASSAANATTLPPDLANADGLARLVRAAAGRIEILPAGGIRAENVAALIRATGVRQVHSACREAADGATSAEAVAGLVREVRQVARAT